MPPAAPVPDDPVRLVRFGTFELDLKTGELRRKGAKVQLQEQPFQVLAMLVGRPGELVTRGELRDRLWPDAVFVDFEHGLNKTVAKIRHALGDLADSPRFVETLERRGYRFIAPVQFGPPPTAHGTPVSLRAIVVRLVWGDHSVPLSEGAHLVGRDDGAAVWIDLPSVSRRHALVSVASASITLVDLGSHNGTFVNGRRIDGVVALAIGDEIGVGSAKVTVRSTSADVPTRAGDDAPTVAAAGHALRS